MAYEVQQRGRQPSDRFSWAGETGVQEAIRGFVPVLARARVAAVDNDGIAWLDDPSDRDGVRPERVEDVLGRLLPPEAMLDADFRQADLEFMRVVAFEPSSGTALCSSGGTLRAMGRTECLLESYADRIRGAETVRDMNEFLGVYLRHGGRMSDVGDAVRNVRAEAMERAVGALHLALDACGMTSALNELKATLAACGRHFFDVRPHLPFDPPQGYDAEDLRSLGVVAAWPDGSAVKEVRNGYRQTTVEAELGPRQRKSVLALGDLPQRSVTGTESSGQQTRKAGGLKL